MPPRTLSGSAVMMSQRVRLISRSSQISLTHTGARRGVTGSAQRQQ